MDIPAIMDVDEISISPAGIEDAPAILDLQRLAYQSEARLYDTNQLPPLTETLDELETLFPSYRFLKASTGNRIIGSVRALERDETCLIGRLIVHPDWQGRGLGKRLLSAIESACPKCTRFELFTGSRSERNLRLYEKMGYKSFRQLAVNASVMLVFLEKHR